MCEMKTMPNLYKLFNLIIAHEPGYYERREALRIVRNIIGNLTVFAQPQSLLLLKVNDPFMAVIKLKEELDLDMPILRAIPLDGETDPYVEDVADIVRELIQEKVGLRRPSFAIKLEGYLYSRKEKRLLHKNEAIRIIAEGIDLPVNLSNPELLVLIKVVKVQRAQRYAGIMVASPDSVFSRARLSR